MMAGNYPPGCTQKHVDMAAPGYWDEPEEDEMPEPEDEPMLTLSERVDALLLELRERLSLTHDGLAEELLEKATALLEELQAALAMCKLERDAACHQMGDDARARGAAEAALAAAEGERDRYKHVAANVCDALDASITKYNELLGERNALRRAVEDLSLIVGRAESPPLPSGELVERLEHHAEHFAHGLSKEAAAALRSRDADLARAVEALDAMLRHSCVADSAPEDKDAEDHDAERRARDVLATIHARTEQQGDGS